ncbi:MAG: MFS transporter [Clostridia bacterium]|nr:MFS transporter [Clostridia bacterium]
MSNKKIRKNEALLWFGSWTSRIGNIIFDYANSISIVGAFAGKPWILATYQSSETIIQILFNLIGGAKADKGNRKKIVIITDMLAALICGFLSFFVGTGFMAQVMVIVNALLAVVSAFNSPTYKSLIREVIEKERIGFFNSISHAGGEFIRVTGPIIGVGLVGVIGVRGALLFDACTFAVSAASELFLTKLDGTVESKTDKKNVLADIVEGFGYLVKEKKILFLVILASFVNFFLAGYNLLLPYTNIIYDGILDNFYSKALAMEAVGGIISSAVCAKIVNKFKDNILALIVFLFGTGFVLVLEPIFALTANYYLCLIPFALFGISLTAFNIQFMSFVQVAVNENYLGRVFSIIFTVAVLFMPVGSFLFSIFVNASDVNSFYTVGGGIMLLSLLSILIHYLYKKA